MTDRDVKMLLTNDRTLLEDACRENIPGWDDYPADRRESLIDELIQHWECLSQSDISFTVEIVSTRKWDELSDKLKVEFVLREVHHRQLTVTE